MSSLVRVHDSVSGLAIKQRFSYRSSVVGSELFAYLGRCCFAEEVFVSDSAGRCLVQPLADPLQLLGERLAGSAFRVRSCSQLAECAGFYVISAKILEAQKPELAERSSKAADSALDYSKALTSEKLTRARTEMAIKSMMKDIDNDAANYSILLNKYADQCGEAVSDPVKRME
ncbi:MULTISPECIES: hypothetical protein [Pseudomonas]|uniref:Uncharacterized protein n=1 Tax=Pseudomonas wuhanensis TaxID=2954098 RepID=A0ABY9GL32_9PSED|nr:MULTISPECIES: hypothetical protein [unclassified Pseudomonas]WLI10592.1 hypothetical protein PSH65_20265 [Pseudomonas sp. FP603]WLI16406.1 hypothetical protein PSH88_18890 [Pseudomonas sp. FP607]